MKLPVSGSQTLDLSIRIKILDSSHIEVSLLNFTSDGDQAELLDSPYVTPMQEDQKRLNEISTQLNETIINTSGPGLCLGRI